MAQAFMDWTYAYPNGETAVDVKPFAERLAKERAVLPFLSLPFAEDLSARLEELTPYFRGFKHMLVLGIGGSALGARALQKAFFPQQDRPEHKGPWLWIADNVAPASFEAHLAHLPAAETVVVVISKSGGTIETVAQYFLALEWLQNALPGKWKDHVFMVTDIAKGFLRDEANRYQLRSLPVPDYLGGRYSVLSAVGLVPAVFMGMDWKALLAGALEMGRPLAENPQMLADHPAWKPAVWAATMAKQNFSQLIFFSYAPIWGMFGPWFAQLWAESLGKENKGTMPLPAVGVTDQHSLLQMFLDGPRDKACLFLTAPEPAADKALPKNLAEPWAWLSGCSLGRILEAETLATRMSLAEHRVPLVHLNMANTSAHAAGSMIMLLEACTVFTGWLLGINPIDQPAVEEGKRLAYAQLGAAQREVEAARLAAFLQKNSVKTFF